MLFPPQELVRDYGGMPNTWFKPIVNRMSCGPGLCNLLLMVALKLEGMDQVQVQVANQPPSRPSSRGPGETCQP